MQCCGMLMRSQQRCSKKVFCLKDRGQVLQICRKCKQGHQDHAERHNAYVEAYTQHDEDQVFEDHFQIQVAPCHGNMHRVQYLMLLHERASACGRAVSTPCWLATGFAYIENMPYSMRISECGILCGQNLGFWPTCGLRSSGRHLQVNIMPLAWN